MVPGTDLTQKLANDYLAALTRRNHPNPPIFLIFSGIPGSGKTVLARRLAEDLQAQYIRHDDMREALRRDGYDVNGIPMAPVSRLIINHIMAHDNNKFIIVDASIDRTWHVYFDHVKQLRAKPFVIRMEVPLALAKQRLADRDGPASQLLANLSLYKQQYDNCRQQVPADLVLGPDYRYETVLATVRQLL